MPRTTKTMYMHTLDGKPATMRWCGGLYLYVACGRFMARLVPSLADIRREQQEAIAFARSLHRLEGREDPSRYGYVLVEVPTS